MNTEQLEDLKQFITAIVSQQTADLYGKIDTVEMRIHNVERNLNIRIDTLDEKLDRMQDAIAETITEGYKDHEVRITRLERKLA